ncbi:MAG: methyltransferase [Mycoplasma sp.]|nr:methyltransferase [Candidatus Hennigella equi]
MTFNQLFNSFIAKHGNTHDVIFFELIFYVSPSVKTKDQFIQKRNETIDFKEKFFWKLVKQYFVEQKPLAHIIGQTRFCDLIFKVSPKVLAPRDITEQMTRDFIDKHKNDKPSHLVDLCCGCGCIGISIKKYIPQFTVACIDKYWKPIFDTRDNGIKHQTQLTVDCVDAIKYLARKGNIDYLISNPPYINKENFANEWMFKYEDKHALIAPDNGLYFYKEYFKWLDQHTFKEAWFEIGYDLEKPLMDLAKDFQNIKVSFIPNKQYIVIKRKQ